MSPADLVARPLVRKGSKAMAAHRRLLYQILTNGQEWVDRGTQETKNGGWSGRSGF